MISVDCYFNVFHYLTMVKLSSPGCIWWFCVDAGVWVWPFNDNCHDSGSSFWSSAKLPFSLLESMNSILGFWWYCWCHTFKAIICGYLVLLTSWPGSLSSRLRVFSLVFYLSDICVCALNPKSLILFTKPYYFLCELLFVFFLELVCDWNCLSRK